MAKTWWLWLPLALLVASYGLLPHAARHSVEIWLTGQGFSDPTFQLEYPEWNRLLIRKLSVVKETADSRIKLEAGPVTVHYDLRQLFGQQRFDVVEISRADLEIHRKPTPNIAKSRAKTPLSGLLPDQWLRYTPADRFQIGELTLQLYRPDKPDLKLTGNIAMADYEIISRFAITRGNTALGRADLQLDDQNRFRFALLRDNRPFYQLSGITERQEQRLSIATEQQAELRALLDWLHNFQPELELPEVAAVQNLTGKISAAGAITMPMTLPADPTKLIEQLSLGQQIDVKLSGELPAAPFSDGLSQFGANIQLNEQRLQLELDPKAEFRLNSFLSGDIKTKQLTVTNKEPIRISCTLPICLPTVSPLDVTLSSTPISLRAGRRVSFSPINLKAKLESLSPLQISGRVQARNISPSVPRQILPDFSVDNRFDLRNDLLSNRFDIKALKTPLRIRGSGKYQLAQQQLDLNWQLTPFALKQTEYLMNRYMPPAPPELSVLAGTLFHRGWARWRNNRLTLTSTQEVKDLAFKWDQTLFEQFNWQSEAKLKSNGELNDSGEIRIGRVTAGLPVDRTKLKYKFRQNRKGRQTVQVNSLSSRILNSRIKLQPFSFNPAKPDIRTLASIVDLDLQKLLELHQQHGISGEGTLSGQLPLHYTREGLTITDGNLSGDAPGGRIRYQPNEGIQTMALANPGLKMAFQALRNFHYQTLDIEMDYQPDGTALLKTRLTGNNPDWNNSQPVNFSINIEENLPKLLQTLMFTQRLTESIEKRYR